MKKTLTITALAVAGFATANAQLVLTGTTTSQNFDGIGNSATATLPTGWKMETTAAGTDTNYSTLETATSQSAGTSGAGILSSSSSGGAYNFADGVTNTSTDRAIGYLNSGSFTTGKSIEFGITNSTGATITDISLDWDYEKYRSGSRAWTWNFYTSTDGVTWTAVPAGNLAYAADAGNTVVSNPPSSTAAGADITGLNIANGQSYYFRWTLVGTGGSTNGQGLAIDNVVLNATTAAIPEPATATMLLGGFGAMLWMTRRKRVA